MTMNNETTSATITTWIKAAKSKDGPALMALLHKDVVFAPPFVEEPIHGPAKALATLGLFSRATENFDYARTWVSGDSAILEFKAEIGDLTLHGLDLLEINEAGQITKFEVMARPHSAIALMKEAYLSSGLAQNT